MSYPTWSPPGWMKTNGSVGGGDKDPSKNKLRPDMRAEFAEFCVAYVRALKEAGIGLYGLSLQNEMYFSQDFASCQYTSQEMVDLIYTQKLYEANVTAFNASKKMAQDTLGIQ